MNRFIQKEIAMSHWVDLKALAERLQVAEQHVEALLGNPALLEARMAQMPVEPFLSQKGISIYHDDFITSHALAEESVDLFVTSPPYKVGIDYSEHDDTESYPAYLQFSQRWLAKAYQIAKADGRVGHGFDISQEYCELAQKRLETLWLQPKLI